MRGRGQRARTGRRCRVRAFLALLPTVVPPPRRGRAPVLLRMPRRHPHPHARAARRLRRAGAPGRRRRPRGSIPQPLVPAPAGGRLLDRDAGHALPDAHPQLRLPAEPVRRAGPAHALVRTHRARHGRLRMGPDGRHERRRSRDRHLLRRPSRRGARIRDRARRALPPAGVHDDSRGRRAADAPAGPDVLQRRDHRRAGRPPHRRHPTRPCPRHLRCAQLRQSAGCHRVARACRVLQHRGARGAARVAGDVPADRVGRPRLRLPAAAAVPLARGEHLGNRLHGRVRAVARCDDPAVAG